MLNPSAFCKVLLIPGLISLLKWYWYEGFKFNKLLFFRFYFPTYENDAFLCQIEDGINDNKEELNSDLSEAL